LWLHINRSVITAPQGEGALIFSHGTEPGGSGQIIDGKRKTRLGEKGEHDGGRNKNEKLSGNEVRAVEGLLKAELTKETPLSGLERAVQSFHNGGHPYLENVEQFAGAMALLCLLSGGASCLKSRLYLNSTDGWEANRAPPKKHHVDNGLAVFRKLWRGHKTQKRNGGVRIWGGLTRSEDRNQLSTTECAIPRSVSII